MKIFYHDNKPFYIEETTSYSEDVAVSAGVPANHKETRKYYFANDALIKYEPINVINEGMKSSERAVWLRKTAKVVVDYNTCDE